MTETPSPNESARLTGIFNDDETPIRRGSPFAKATSRGDAVPGASGALRWQQIDQTFDPEWGVLRAANWASAWVALCAIACLQMFPGGGVVVTALGCGLATIGLFSSRAIAATMLLVLHACLFFACYQRLF